MTTYSRAAKTPGTRQRTALNLAVGAACLVLVSGLTQAAESSDSVEVENTAQGSSKAAIKVKAEQVKEKTQTEESGKVIQVDPVVVSSDKIGALSSYTNLNQQEIQEKTTGNGNITDLLRTNPAVQFSSSSLNSLQQGELRPADVSIHGALPYSNNFTLDGTSINSDIDPYPMADATTTRNSAADDQGFYIDSRLLENVVVYDHNIPVEYSGFTGGTIDAQTKSWTGENHVHVFTRMSNGSWGKTHYDPILDTVNVSGVNSPARDQRDVKKKTYGFSAEWGITDNLGIVLGYSHRDSELYVADYPGKFVTIEPDGVDWAGDPAYKAVLTDAAGGMHKQKRKIDNFFSKATLYATDRTSADLSFNYSNAQSDSFLPSMADSAYKDRHTGYNVTFNVNHEFDAAVWNSTLAYSKMEDKRTAGRNSYIVFSDYSDWQNPESYKTGSYGSFTQNQDIVTGKMKLEFRPLTVGTFTSHQFSVGAEVETTKAKYHNPTGLYNYQITSSGPDNPASIITSWTPDGEYSTNLNNYGVWGQHVLRIKDVSLRTGVRLETNTFNHDVNFSPRFSGTWDVQGNGSTVFNVGANRYYARNMLTYALQKAWNQGSYTTYEYVPEGSGPSYEYWGSQKNGWKGFDKLKTPYTDEFSVGGSQRWGNVLSSLVFVHRNGHDEIRGHAENSERYYANDGESTTDSVILSLNNIETIQFLKANHRVRASLSWEKTRSSIPISLGYNEMSPNMNTEKVIYDGKLIDAKDLKGTDFNIPVRLLIETTSSWDPWGVTWYNQLRWNSKRTQAEYDDTQVINGQEYYQYSKQRYPSTWIWDSKLMYKPDWAKGVGVSLEVYNVLNNKNPVARGQYDSNKYFTIYEPGRQFWVQLTYDY